MSYLVKLMARQQPGSANVLAPVLGLVAALMVFAAIPFGENITWAGQIHAVQVSDPGLLYVLAVLVLFFRAAMGRLERGRPVLAFGRGAPCGPTVGLLAVHWAQRDRYPALERLGVAGGYRPGAGAQLWALPLWNRWLQPLGCVVFAVAGLCWTGLPPLIG